MKFWNGNIMKTQSRKAKGRRLQQKFMQLLIEELGIDPEDIESRSMGAGGEDLIMSKAADISSHFLLSVKTKRS